jgi:hypothetical protein
MDSINERAFSGLIDLIGASQQQPEIRKMQMQNTNSGQPLAIPYFCADRGHVHSRFQALRDTLVQQEILQVVNVNVSKISGDRSRWRLVVGDVPLGESYDAVVLSAGAVWTPVLLMKSGLIGAAPYMPIKDHAMVFALGDDYEAKYTLIPALKSLQLVTSRKNEIGYSHDVLVHKPIKMNAESIASIYCTVAGRSPGELLFSHPLELAMKVARGAWRGRLRLGGKRPLKVTLGDENHCSARLRLDEEEPFVEWESRTSREAVSAFHFHGSLENRKEVADLDAVGIYLGDVSVSSSFRDANNGAYSYQLGYIAMENALGGA